MRGVKEQLKVNREEEKKRQLEEQKNNTDHAKIIEPKLDPLPPIEEDQSPAGDSNPTDLGPSVSSRNSSSKSAYLNLASMGQKSFISLAKAAGLTESRPVTACSINSYSTGRTFVPSSLRSLDNAAKRSRASLRAIETPSSSYSDRAGIQDPQLKLDSPLSTNEIVVNEDNIHKTLPQKHKIRPSSTKRDVDNQIITEIQKEEMKKNKKKSGSKHS